MKCTLEIVFPPKDYDLSFEKDFEIDDIDAAREYVLDELAGFWGRPSSALLQTRDEFGMINHEETVYW